jgi:predicted ATPase
MIKSVTFTKDYELSLEKDSQKRWGTKTYKPTRYSREKKPWKMFFLFRKGLHIDFNEGVNVIVGENGSGKTTLFHLIKHYSGKPPDRMTFFASDYETEEEYFQNYHKDYKGELKIDGDLNYRNTVYFDAEKDNPVVAIPQMLSPDRKDFPSLVSEMFDAQEESHGESMLPVLHYILKNAKNCTIFMDEPETALSLRNQWWLVNEMNKSVKNNGNQIIISTHAYALIQEFNTIFDMETRKWVNREDYINEIIKNIK